MAWTIPDKGEGQDNRQSNVYQEYLDVLVAGIQGIDCVLGGCAVTAQGSPDMTCAVAKGSVLSNGTLFAVTAGNVTITAADSTHPRIDLVVVNSSGTKAVRAGTAAAAPKPPARTANDVVLAVVWVPAGDTTISSDQIVDLRVLRTQGPIVVFKSTAGVTFNTTNVAQTYVSLTIPNGLLLAGRALRVRMGGNYLSNSGSPTWTLTVRLGGTTLFADATAATTADTDRGAWSVDLDLIAQGNSAQRLVGLVNFQTPGAKTAPANGVGDMAVVTHLGAPIRGTAAENADSGDLTFLITWTMSVSNAAVETVMDYATVELL